MATRQDGVSIESLLVQERWVRRLARALVGDTDEAEDLVQEARIAFWRRPPAQPEKARSWLGSVIRNAVRNRARDRRARESLLAAAAATAESSREPEPDRLELHRRLAALVSALDEPLKQTIVLRYYEGLSAAEIVRRTGVPAGTVRWRLMTALERMRSRLDEEHGGRKRWMVIVASLDGPGRKVGVGLWPAFLVAAGGLGVVAFLAAGGSPRVAANLAPSRRPEIPRGCIQRPLRVGGGAMLARGGLLVRCPRWWPRHWGNGNSPRTRRLLSALNGSGSRSAARSNWESTS
jgi:RNA polymerase sigma-70 factor (ECF subfamily)